jgi:hypothetical protein
MKFSKALLLKFSQEQAVETKPEVENEPFVEKEYNDVENSLLKVVVKTFNDLIGNSLPETVESFYLIIDCLLLAKVINNKELASSDIYKILSGLKNGTPVVNFIGMLVFKNNMGYFTIKQDFDRIKIIIDEVSKMHDNKYDDMVKSIASLFNTYEFYEAFKRIVEHPQKLAEPSTSEIVTTLDKAIKLIDLYSPEFVLRHVVPQLLEDDTFKHTFLLKIYEITKQSYSVASSVLIQKKTNEFFNKNLKLFFEIISEHPYNVRVFENVASLFKDYPENKILFVDYIISIFNNLKDFQIADILLELANLDLDKERVFKLFEAYFSITGYVVNYIADFVDTGSFSTGEIFRVYLKKYPFLEELLRIKIKEFLDLKYIDSPLYTFGTSPHTIHSFVQLLKKTGLYPGDDKFSHFYSEILKNALPSASFSLSHMFYEAFGTKEGANPFIYESFINGIKKVDDKQYTEDLFFVRDDFEPKEINNIFVNSWKRSSRTPSSQAVQLVAKNLFPGEVKTKLYFNEQTPEKFNEDELNSVIPEKTKENIKIFLQDVYKRTQNNIKSDISADSMSPEVKDNAVHLFRGVGAKVNIPSVFESWTSDKGTATSFDGYDIMEAWIPLDAIYVMYRSPDWESQGGAGDGEREYIIIRNKAFSIVDQEETKRKRDLIAGKIKEILALAYYVKGGEETLYNELYHMTVDELLKDNNIKISTTEFNVSVRELVKSRVINNVGGAYYLVLESTKDNLETEIMSIFKKEKTVTFTYLIDRLSNYFNDVNKVEGILKDLIDKNLIEDEGFNQYHLREK